MMQFYVRENILIGQREICCTAFSKEKIACVSKDSGRFAIDQLSVACIDQCNGVAVVKRDVMSLTTHSFVGLGM